MIKKISKEEMDELMANIEKEKVARAEKMPDEKAAIAQMFEAYERLKELGWKDIIYCPKDGGMFSSLEVGSTGIHETNYTGEWPNGSWWSYDGDQWPAHPAMWRPRTDDDPKIDLGTCMQHKCCKH